ncbi:MAG: alpha/beta hydrolase [Bacteroidales bacterium]|nr:alpha/beta hydrolase [Bacteroidales bacterium]
MKEIIAILLFMMPVLSGFSQTPRVPTGTIRHFTDFPSQYVTPRNVDIWLPENYSPTRKYAVLYMNDGQMLFDSTMTWNHQSWKVAQTAEKLMQEGKVMNFIVVGIWNIPELRFTNYFPQKPYESIPKDRRDSISDELQKSGAVNGDFQPNSDDYLRFLVKELKPYVDQNFSVYTDAAHTFIAGSSMGGLISWYALCEYPDVFGGAACMSTHWPGLFSMENNPIPEAFVNYLKAHLPPPSRHKFYFDYGNKTLDALYAEPQKEVDRVMKSAGYTNVNWITRFYPGDDHSEKSWSSRLSVPLVFLLGK